MKLVRFLALSLFLVLAAGSITAQDRIDDRPPARFTNGLHVNVRGSSRALFAEGPAQYAPPGLIEQSVTVQLDLQATVRVGDVELAAGRHRVSIDLSPRTDWRLRLEGGNVPLDVKTVDENEVDLSVRFARQAEEGIVDLVVSWGKLRGRVTCIVEPALRRAVDTAADVDPESLDLARLRSIRSAQLDVAARLVAASRTRGRWIDALVAIRDAAVNDGASIQLFDVKLEHADGAVRLSLAGESHVPDLDAVNRFADALRGSPLAKIFPAIGRPVGEVIHNAKGDAARWRFVVLCECPDSAWTPRVERIAGQAAADDVAALTEEIAFLDRWLTAFAGPGRSVGNVRSKMRALLDLRRATGVALPALEPGESVDELDGTYLRYAVALEVLGRYEGVVQFLDGLEAWQAPMTWDLANVLHDEIGTRARFQIEFLSYRSPAADSSALRAALASVESGDDYDDRLAAYVKALPAFTRRDRYEPPAEAARDPFVDPSAKVVTEEGK